MKGQTEAEMLAVASYLFHQGTNYRAFEYLGAMRIGDRFLFRVWAPHADAVSVCGDFNDWNRSADFMTRQSLGGVWELSLPASRIRAGQCYKYCIRKGERELLKADPYATHMQMPPETASVIADPISYAWRDEGWMRYRRSRFDRAHVMQQPLNIYEIHVGSWKKKEDGAPYSYAELAGELAPYLKQMGYTHVELMPIAEHPFYGSWGYQVCGHYAPTARYGSPEELMQFVDGMHEAGIGVILDWVPAHFPKDAHGLFEFDGEPLYGCSNEYREHRGWGTVRFDIGRAEVRSFLISNAVYWIEKFHVDGLRVDAVSAMLYPDGVQEAGAHGERLCTEAVEFFQRLNTYLCAVYPDVMTVAEEASAWKHITGFENGGLGFSLKWSMGWMNDSLSYLATAPQERSGLHDRMTFSSTYAYDEHYVLPISHDEVVHGKGSLLGRCAGEYRTKFAETRAFMTYMMTHPGKKLTFMGCELGTFREWDHEREQEWFLTEYEMHGKMQLFTACLNRFYLSTPALWQGDGDSKSFAWLDADDAAHCLLSYRRIAPDGTELTVLLNFSQASFPNHPLAVSEGGIYEEVFNTDEQRFGGTGMRNAGALCTVWYRRGTYTHAVRLNIPASSALILRRIR